ncbi:MAG TPA: polyprenyl synthetase family protein [Desulfosalsimonadaceae bacterium]|nr:polyprenyl synthetase family protein [Desulfosalsimonadaceae bacterium]
MAGLKNQLISRVEPDLQNIEAALQENLRPHLELISEAAGHLIFSGGKRLRPLLNILCARLCNYDDPFVTEFSTIIEFLHTATLLHDDVVDGATLRRGKPVTHSLFGAPVTVLVGDFLLARALSIAARTRNPKIIRIISEITEHMCQGEIQQLSRKGDINLQESDYMEVIRCKTGYLIQGACQTGAILAGAEEETEKQLSDYGYHIGIVFQIADDLLDYTADTSTLGKAVGADLREGKLTLPVIRALNQADGDVRAEMTAIITKEDFSPAEFHHLVKMIDAHGGIAYAREVAAEHVQAAKTIMEGFPPSESRELLSLIADYALHRSA